MSAQNPTTIAAALARAAADLSTGTALGARAARRLDRQTARQVAMLQEVLDGALFHPVFQPVYSLTDGTLMSVEALTRFTALDLPTSPAAWFAAAAATGTRVPLELAAAQAALDGAGYLPAGLPVSVNASAATIAHPLLTDLVAAADRPVCVELTEHDPISDYRGLSQDLARLRSVGAQIAVDDAGSGMATMGHVLAVAPDMVKLDMSLARGVSTDPYRKALAEGLTHFTKATGTYLVVEGIEDEPDLHLWAELGADAAQGYLLGKPAAAVPAASCDLVPGTTV